MKKIGFFIIPTLLISLIGCSYKSADDILSESSNSGHIEENYTISMFLNDNIKHDYSNLKKSSYSVNEFSDLRVLEDSKCGLLTVTDSLIGDINEEFKLGVYSVFANKLIVDLDSNIKEIKYEVPNTKETEKPINNPIYISVVYKDGTYKFMNVFGDVIPFISSLELKRIALLDGQDLFIEKFYDSNYKPHYKYSLGEYGNYIDNVNVTIGEETYAKYFDCSDIGLPGWYLNGTNHYLKSSYVNPNNDTVLKNHFPLNIEYNRTKIVGIYGGKYYLQNYYFGNPSDYLYSCSYDLVKNEFKEIRTDYQIILNEYHDDIYNYYYNSKIKNATILNAKKMGSEEVKQYLFTNELTAITEIPSNIDLKDYDKLDTNIFYSNNSKVLFNDNLEVIYDFNANNREVLNIDYNSKLIYFKDNQTNNYGYMNYAGDDVMTSNKELLPYVFNRLPSENFYDTYKNNVTGDFLAINSGTELIGFNEETLVDLTKYNIKDPLVDLISINDKWTYLYFVSTEANSSSKIVSLSCQFINEGKVD